MNVKAPAAVSSLANEFREFLVKQNALALAVGVILGAAIGKVVSGIVDDVFMPLVGLVLPSGEWRGAQLVLHGENAIKYGDLIGRVIDFIIVSAVVFLVVKMLVRKKPGPTTTKPCPKCLETIPLAATRCRACCADL